MRCLEEAAKKRIRELARAISEGLWSAMARSTAVLVREEGQAQEATTNSRPAEGEKQTCAPPIAVARSPAESCGASRGAPDGVATLKVREGAFAVLNKGSGALEK